MPLSAMQSIAHFICAYAWQWGQLKALALNDGGSCFIGLLIRL
jgi:hypothetical protein